jgi:hypothetical protein
LLIVNLMPFTKTTRQRGLYLLVAVFLTEFGYCQSKPDTSSVAYNDAKEFYFKSLGPELSLYNGIFYRGYNRYPNDEGQPYFGTDELAEGSVFYDGTLYENVEMLYDLLEDKLIIDHKYGAVRLELITKKIRYFTLNKHRFVYLTAETKSSPPSGLYELLYNGNYKVYARWKKKKISVANAHDLQTRYEEHYQFYIYKDEVFIPVKSKSSVLNVLIDKKPALQKFIRKQKLKFGARGVESLPKILTFYEADSDR